MAKFKFTVRIEEVITNYYGETQVEAETSYDAVREVLQLIAHGDLAPASDSRRQYDAHTIYCREEGGVGPNDIKV